jgi:catechol 2,3-dioxygenase-like lactoylglutathione lyase family enzyme
MARTTGLTFIVPVRDVDASVRFYCDAFGLKETFRGDNIVFVGNPGSDTAIGIIHNAAEAGSGPQYVGLHLDHSVNLGEAVQEVESAGGRVQERGEHAPGVPFARITDPDGNELWI